MNEQITLQQTKAPPGVEFVLHWFNNALAGVEGFEPATPGFGDQCSNQLSYTPIVRHNYITYTPVKQTQSLQSNIFARAK